jgi:hypothetical protein
MKLLFIKNCLVNTLCLVREVLFCRAKWWTFSCSCPVGMVMFHSQLFWSPSPCGQENSCSPLSSLVVQIVSEPTAPTQMRKTRGHTSGSLLGTQR